MARGWEIHIGFDWPNLLPKPAVRNYRPGDDSSPDWYCRRSEQHGLALDRSRYRCRSSKWRDPELPNVATQSGDIWIADRLCAFPRYGILASQRRRSQLATLLDRWRMQARRREARLFV